MDRFEKYMLKSKAFGIRPYDQVVPYLKKQGLILCTEDIRGTEDLLLHFTLAKTNQTKTFRMDIDRHVLNGHIMSKIYSSFFVSIDYVTSLDTKMIELRETQEYKDMIAKRKCVRIFLEKEAAAGPKKRGVKKHTEETKAKMSKIKKEQYANLRKEQSQT